MAMKVQADLPCGYAYWLVVPRVHSASVRQSWFWDSNPMHIRFHGSRFLSQRLRSGRSDPRRSDKASQAESTLPFYNLYYRMVGCDSVCSVFTSDFVGVGGVWSFCFYLFIRVCSSGLGLRPRLPGWVSTNCEGTGGLGAGDRSDGAGGAPLCLSFPPPSSPHSLVILVHIVP